MGQGLAKVLVGLMCVEACPEAYSENEAREIWTAALDAVEGATGDRDAGINLTQVVEEYLSGEVEE